MSISEKLHQEAALPIKSTNRSVGLDLFALLLTEQGRPTTAIVPPRTTRSIPTGLSLMIPSVTETPPRSYYGLVMSRPGMPFRSLFVMNAPIDPDDTGELFVYLYNGGSEVHYVKNGDRIAQLVITSTPVYDVRGLNA